MRTAAKTQAQNLELQRTFESTYRSRPNLSWGWGSEKWGEQPQVHCSLMRVQPLDSEISAPSRRLACLPLPTNLLGVGEIFLLGSLARLPGPPCIYCGSLKGENWGPQDSKSPRRDTADEGLEVRRLYLETALDYLQLCDQHCPLVASCCQGSLSSVTQSRRTL